MQSVGSSWGESTTPLFGGNSNWRGPIWMPVNYLAVEALRAYDAGTGSALRVELPARSGRHITLASAADELARRLVSIFTLAPTGGGPSNGHIPSSRTTRGFGT